MQYTRKSENPADFQQQDFRIGGRGWIRTTEAKTRQIYSLFPLATRELSHIYFSHQSEKKWSWWTDLNPRPADYKSAALPTELHQRIAAFNQVLKYYTT